MMRVADDGYGGGDSASDDDAMAMKGSKGNPRVAEETRNLIKERSRASKCHAGEPAQAMVARDRGRAKQQRREQGPSNARADDRGGEQRRRHSGPRSRLNTGPRSLVGGNRRRNPTGPTANVGQATTNNGAEERNASGDAAEREERAQWQRR
ncbi:hypothetical protein Syun_022640 [Stephania yunnanensis]|uniref:Uncharacterized protein n=1 Tax=Stephania yunnanensis TaxID=152371 RepID=A0AAP0FL90_9MAGN